MAGPLTDDALIAEALWLLRESPGLNRAVRTLRSYTDLARAELAVRAPLLPSPGRPSLRHRLPSRPHRLTASCVRCSTTGTTTKITHRQCEASERWLSLGGIFINYRRGDHIDMVSVLDNRLAQHFGRDQVFLDVSSIPPGAQYPDVLKKRLLSCDVVLAVIHAQWLTECSANGTRRLDDEGDWVRQELELALQGGKKIIPVLLRDVPMPGAGDLPESICDVVDWLAHRIRVDSPNSDIEELISQIECDVAPIWTPSDAIETVTSWQPGRWLTILTAALAIVVLAAPSVLALNTAPPARGFGEASLVLGFAIFSLLLMCAPLGAVAVVMLFRSSINFVERDLHGVSAGEYNKRVMMPLIVVMLAPPLLIWAPRDSELGILIWLLFALWSLVYVGTKMIRREKVEDELRRNWSYQLPTLLYPLVLRQGVTLLENQLKGWTRPLSKERRERAMWMLDALGRGAEKMREGAQRGRWCWLSDHPWLITVYTLWVAVTTGLTMAAVVSLLRIGRQPSWHVYLLPVFVLLASGALCWGTIDLGYRRHRWEGRMVAAEVTENVKKLRRHVDGLAAPSSWDLVDPRAAQHMNRRQAPG